MRKFYTILLITLLSVNANSQLRRMQHENYGMSRKVNGQMFIRDDAFELPNIISAKHPNPPLALSASAKSMWLWEQVIGYTTYDNQTNNAVQHRIYVDDTDRVHATWNMSLQSNSTTWTDRGTGYNSGQGYVWEPEPYDRIEDERTGWPGLVKLGNGGEAIFCHTSNGGITLQTRATPGTGSWTSSTVPTSIAKDFIWPRAAVDGNTIHLIAVTEPVTGDTGLVNGLRSNLVYWRSNDNGASWSIQDHIFDEILASEYEYIAGDAYAIDAKNGKVSIAIFCEFDDSAMLRSEDGGDNWTYSVFFDFPIDGYQYDHVTDVENDGIIDTLDGTDGTGAILIAADGTTHVTFGRFAFYDDDAGDTLYTTFPGVQDLLYWNSNLAVNEIYVIGYAQESAFDNDTTLGITSIDQLPEYRCALASMPTMGEDADGNIYVVFSAADEEYLGDQIFRHLYVTKTEDGGTNWIDPVELTPDEDINEYEYVFPSMVRDIDDKLHIVVQRDQEPGLNVRGDLDDWDENSIVYLAVTTDFDITINTPETTSTAESFQVFPNPTEGVVTIMGTNLAGATLKLYNQLGQEMISTKLGKNFNANDKQVFDFSYLPTGKYTLAVGTGKNKMTKEILIQH